MKSNYLISKCFGITNTFSADGALSDFSLLLGRRKAPMYEEHMKAAQLRMTSPFLPTVPSRDVSPPQPSSNGPTKDMNEAAFRFLHALL